MKLRFLLLSVCLPAMVHATPPDVFLISVDTLRADRLGCYGYSLDTSPHIDQLAERGLLFEDVVTEVPLTGPAFGAMMASRVPRATGAVRNGLPIPDDVPLAAERFQAAGYETWCVQSNWTLKADMSGLSRGFDVYDDDFRRRRWGFFAAERRGDEVTRLALSLLEKRQPGKPLFMWIHYSDPHAPYRWRRNFNPAGEPLRRMDKDDQIRARYDSEVAFTDSQIGRILAVLPKENAYIVFVSDHGESLMEHGYLGHGRRIYNNNMHIPLIVAGPGIAPGRDAAPLRGIDLGPTLLGLAGLEPLPGMQGLNVLAESPEPGRARVVETYGGAAIVPGMRDAMAESGPLWQGVVIEDWKLVTNGSADELYNLAEDPGELENLADTEPDRVLALTEIIDEWTEAHPRGEPGEKQLTDDDIEALKRLGYL